MAAWASAVDCQLRPDSRTDAQQSSAGPSSATDWDNGHDAPCQRLRSRLRAPHRSCHAL